MRTRTLVGLALTGIVGLAAGCSSTPTSGTGSTSTSAAGSGSTATSSPGPGSTTTSSPGPTSTGPVSSSASSALTTALTKEHDAKATYDNVVAHLGDIGPFASVSSAESQHISTLEALAANHSVSLPSGPFTGQSAPDTKTAACQLGVSTEQAVVSMYDQLLPQVSGYPDLSTAFTNLRAAAQDNHLPAFEHCA